ncbi:MAG: DUF308 domain-containing protein [bacterium]|nr:DUF308 domain-containing protein [bacterium]
MMVGMLVAGIGLVLAGLLATGYGISIKEFSTGNTLIISGVIGVCTGAIMLALYVAIRELKTIARKLGGDMPAARGEVTVRPVLPPGLTRDPAPAETTAPLAPPIANGDAPPAPPPWQDETVLRDHPMPESAPAEAAPKPKRNLLFSSTSRKERERAQSRTSEPLPPDMLSADLRPNPPAVPPVQPAEPPPASFDDAWPKTDRPKPGDVPPQRRSAPRPPPPPAAEANGAQAGVTVLKSGVVDGMAYSLYSDGSIEAQMPEGMMRFASIDELRAHLDSRP